MKKNLNTILQLIKKSVVNITKIYTVNKNDLNEKTGKVNSQRIKEINKGINLLIESKNL